MSKLTRELQEFKEEHEKLKQTISRAEGAFGIVKEELKDNYGCKTFKEAKELHEQMEQEETELEERIRSAIELYRKEKDARLKHSS